MTDAVTVEALRHVASQLLWMYGGAATVLVAFSNWLGQLWLNRQLQREQNALNLRLATFNHDLNTKLEAYRLALQASLATYSARAGALSEVQLKATDEIWAKVFRVQWDVVNRASPWQRIEVRVGGDWEEAVEEYDRRAQEALVTLDKARLELVEAVHGEKPFLPAQLFDLLNDYCSGLAVVVGQLVDEREERKMRTADESAQAWVVRRRKAREDITAQVKRLGELHEGIAEAIRGLVSPPPPVVT